MFFCKVFLCQVLLPLVAFRFLPNQTGWSQVDYFTGFWKPLIPSFKLHTRKITPEHSLIMIRILWIFLPEVRICYIFCQARYQKHNEADPGKNKHLAILCDLFGMVKWPFQGLSDLQLGDQKVTLNHLAVTSLNMSLTLRSTLFLSLDLEGADFSVKKSAHDAATFGPCEQVVLFTKSRCEHTLGINLQPRSPKLMTSWWSR